MNLFFLQGSKAKSEEQQRWASALISLLTLTRCGIQEKIRDIRLNHMHTVSAPYLPLLKMGVSRLRGAAQILGQMEESAVVTATWLSYHHPNEHLYLKQK